MQIKVTLKLYTFEKKKPPYDKTIFLVLKSGLWTNAVFKKSYKGNKDVFLCLNFQVFRYRVLYWAQVPDNTVFSEQVAKQLDKIQNKLYGSKTDSDSQARP